MLKRRKAAFYRLTSRSRQRWLQKDQKLLAGRSPEFKPLRAGQNIFVVEITRQNTVKILSNIYIGLILRQ